MILKSFNDINPIIDTFILLCNESKLNQSQIAKLINSDRSQVNRMLKKRGLPNIRQLNILLTHLGYGFIIYKKRIRNSKDR